MIVVSGTRRAGTSMWMRALKAAGLPAIGEAFPRDWATLFPEANPAGFFESSLVDGVNFTTNPDPLTGAWLDPAETAAVAVKIFLPGLQRTGFPYLGRVLLCCREWRAYHHSADRVRRLLQARGYQPALAMPQPPPALGWWGEWYLAVHDLLTRGYPARVVSYEEVISQPEVVVPAALEWLGVPCDVDAALAQIERREPRAAPTPAEVPPRWERALDALYQRLREGPLPDRAFLAEWAPVHAEIAPLIARPPARWGERGPAP